MTNIDSRLVYENAKVALRKAFPEVPSIAEICKLTQSTLRFEQPMTAGNTLYTFPVLVNENRFSDTEIRLLQQDSAIVYQLGVFLAVPGAATDTNFPLLTYPDKNQFSSGTTAQDALALFNGQLSIAVNNDILVPNWDVFKHYYVPESQAHPEGDNAGVPVYPSQINQLRGAIDGFYPVEPNIVLIGSKNNVLQIKVPKGVATVQANSRIIVIARAIIAQNSTVVS